jgi:hypothetical protein
MDPERVECATDFVPFFVGLEVANITVGELSFKLIGETCSAERCATFLINERRRKQKSFSGTTMFPNCPHHHRMSWL